MGDEMIIGFPTFVRITVHPPRKLGKRYNAEISLSNNASETANPLDITIAYIRL